MQNATFYTSALSPCCAMYAGGMQTVKCNPVLRHVRGRYANRLNATPCCAPTRTAHERFATTLPRSTPVDHDPSSERQHSPRAPQCHHPSPFTDRSPFPETNPSRIAR